MHRAAVFNSKYDAWQLGSEFQSNWKTKAEQDGVIQYGKDFMAQLAPVYTGSETKNGGMITVSSSLLLLACWCSSMQLATNAFGQTRI